MTVVMSALHTGRLYPPEIIPGTHFLETESNSGPKCGRRDYASEKFQLQYRQSNPWPSDL